VKLVQHVSYLSALEAKLLQLSPVQIHVYFILLACGGYYYMLLLMYDT